MDIVADKLAEILKREKLLRGFHPICPQCHSEQVQSMDRSKPAKWRCRRCGTTFIAEPA